MMTMLRVGCVDGRESTSGLSVMETFFVGVENYYERIRGNVLETPDVRRCIEQV